MTEFLEILKYTLPAIIVSLCAVWLFKSYLKMELDKSQLEAKSKVSAKTIQVRLQAYERIVLFLERISPQHLVLRIDITGLDVARYQRMLLQTIREEFEHNLAQQIYISPKAWELVKSAKESVVKLINQSASDLPEDATALNLASKIVELNMLEGSNQLDDAIGFVKKEVREMF